MYGTIAKMRVKPGQMDGFKKMMDDFNATRHPKGYLGELVYQMDNNPNELLMAVFFSSKEDYHANDPEQDKEYQKMRGFLEADPEWHDGEVIHQFWKG